MPRWLLILVLTSAGLLALTVPFWIWPIDIAVQSAFFDSDRGGWFLHDAQPWHTLYHFGTLPGILFGFGAIAVFAFGIWNPKWTRWRRVSLYFILCMIMGPGVLVNLIFKENWGRPRPREVVEFGGEYAYEKVWTYDASSPGKSFPCGHCSMGFCFFALAFVLRDRRKLALAAAGGAFGLGTIVGLTRVIQGGHFLSDVLWAGGFCLLTSIGLYFALGLNRSLIYEPPRTADGKRRKTPFWVIALAVSGSIALPLTVMLAFPYHRVEERAADFSGAEKFELSLKLEGDLHRITLSPESEFQAEMRGEGFGMPGSAIKHVWKDEPPSESEPSHYVQLKQRRSGWFTELKQRNEIRAPAGMSGFARIEVESGDLELDFSAFAGESQKWKIRVKEPGVLRLRRPEVSENLKLEIEAAEVLDW
ncbi:MAG: lipid A 4'-phosphatase [Verrucomicrobiales bacterium]|jgi:lipid A 4'-phosphatase